MTIPLCNPGGNRETLGDSKRWPHRNLRATDYMLIEQSVTSRWSTDTKTAVERLKTSDKVGVTTGSRSAITMVHASVTPA